MVCCQVSSGSLHKMVTSWQRPAELIERKKSPINSPSLVSTVCCRCCDAMCCGVVGWSAIKRGVM